MKPRHSGFHKKSYSFECAMSSDPVWKEFARHAKKFYIVWNQQEKGLNSIIYIQNRARPHIHRSMYSIPTFYYEKVISQLLPSAGTHRSPGITLCDILLVISADRKSLETRHAWLVVFSNCLFKKITSDGILFKSIPIHYA